MVQQKVYGVQIVREAILFWIKERGTIWKTGDIFLGSVICFSVIIGMIGFVKIKALLEMGK